MIVDVTELLRGHHKREVNSAFEQVFLDPPFNLILFLAQLCGSSAA